MYRGITPTFTFNFPDSVDLTQASSVYVTFAKANNVAYFTKTGNDIEVSAHRVDVFLSQTETLSFLREVLVQVNWLYTVEGGTEKRACTKVMKVRTDQNLINEVLTDGN